MISDTLEPILHGGILILFWLFIACMWYIAYWLIKENTLLGDEYFYPSPIDYALGGVTVVVMSAVTLTALVITLSEMGI